MDLEIDRFDSPLGTILLVTDGSAVRALDFEDREDRMRRLLRVHHGRTVLHPARDPGGFRGRLEAYFRGDTAALGDVPVRTGGTPFQRAVWSALRRIASGTTTSYGRLAAQLGSPGAGRAVGLANGSNPVAIIVPCHRVIGADGSLTGYAGGVERKRWLLAHEGAIADPIRPLRAPTAIAGLPT
jgi:methylated-DNA-[protein]-cysteine S-methyltransferase